MSSLTLFGRRVGKHDARRWRRRAGCFCLHILCPVHAAPTRRRRPTFVDSIRGLLEERHLAFRLMYEFAVDLGADRHLDEIVIHIANDARRRAQRSTRLLANTSPFTMPVRAGHKARSRRRRMSRACRLRLDSDESLSGSADTFPLHNVPSTWQTSLEVHVAT